MDNNSFIIYTKIIRNKWKIEESVETSKDFNKMIPESYLADLEPSHMLKLCINSALKAWFLMQIEGRYPSVFPLNTVSNMAEVVILRPRIYRTIPRYLGVTQKVCTHGENRGLGMLKIYLLPFLQAIDNVTKYSFKG